MDYTLKPYSDAGSFEDLAIARQRLVWWLATHEMTKGTIYKADKKVGVIEKADDCWLWYPKGTKTAYKVNSANGNLSTKVE